MVAVGITGLCCFLYWPLLDAGWRFDDPHHLLYAANYSPWQYFFVPEIARLQSGAHFTPFNILVYEICILFGGDCPLVGYLLHLFLVFLISGLVWKYIFLLRGSKDSAWAGALLFLTGFPTIGAANMLMVGHYLVGAVFFLVFLLRYEAVSRYSRGPDLVLCFVYFLACLSKEIYIVAPAVILLDRRADSRIVFHLFATAATLGVFLLMRTLVLQRFVGGYSDDLGSGQWWQALQQLLSGGMGYFLEFPSGYILLVIMGAIGLLAGVNIWRQHGWVWASSAVALFFLVCLGPLLPMANSMDSGNYSGVRWLFFPWLAFSLVVGGALVCRPVLPRWTKFLLMACVVASASYSLDYEYRSGFGRDNKHFDVLSRYVIDQKGCHLVDDRGLSSWVADLARAAQLSRSNWMVAPESLLHVLAPEGEQICRYDAGKLHFVDTVTPGKGRRDFNGSLGLAITYTGTHATIHLRSSLKGRLAFYKPGQYLLYLAPGVSYPLPDPERFNHFHPIVIGEDGATVIIGPLVDFSPMLPGTWRWESNIEQAVDL